MTTRPIPPHVGDPKRLEALRRSGLLAKESQHLDLTSVAKQAACLVGAQAAFVNVIDESVQLTLASYGIDAVGAVTGFEDSFCHYVVGEGKPLVIKDARRDTRVCNSRFTRDGLIVTYMGVPITDKDGFILGTLCVTDPREREWSETDVYMLQSLASLISETLR